MNTLKKDELKTRPPKSCQNYAPRICDIQSFLKKYKRWLYFLVSVVAIVSIFIITRDTWSDVSYIRSIKYGTILGVSIIFLIMQGINGYKLKMFTGMFGIRLTFKEWFGLIWIKSMVNYLPLGSGTIHNSIYLKYRNNFSLAKYASIFSANIVIMLITSGIAGLLVSIQFMIGHDVLIWEFVGFSVLLIIIGSFIAWIPLPKKVSNDRISKTLKNIQNGLEIIKEEKRILLKMAILHLLYLFLLSARFYLIFSDLEYDLPFSNIIFITIVTTFVNVISLLPGNLGIGESIIGTMTKSLGFTFKIGFLVGIIDRVIGMFWIFLLGIFFNFILQRERAVNKSYAHK